MAPPSCLKAYTTERGVKLAQVARELGKVPSVVSEWAAGRYRGDVDAITHAVNDWMERDARRNQSRRPKDYVKTWVAEGIRSYAYLADKRNMMAAIVVPAGAGKTKVLSGRGFGFTGEDVDEVQPAGVRVEVVEGTSQAEAIESLETVLRMVRDQWADVVGREEWIEEKGGSPDQPHTPTPASNKGAKAGALTAA